MNIKDWERKYSELPHGGIGDFGGDFIDYNEVKQFIQKTIEFQKQVIINIIERRRAEYLQSNHPENLDGYANDLIDKIKLTN